MATAPVSGAWEVGAVPAEPIAVVGMSCRFPGATGPEEFWRLLSTGRSAVSDRVAEGRPGLPRGALARPAAFLDAVDDFDPEFFAITPREAAGVDPRQRLVLALVWEALEDAGVVPGALTGTRTGVYLGAMPDDYAQLVHQHGAESIAHRMITGDGRDFIANRISGLLGRRTPGLAVDSAHSSSLVAVHRACEALRTGDRAVALAGGVHLNLAPEEPGAASSDGRCPAFDDHATGHVRGEGGGVVVLKTLSRALADGDTVHGLIRGGSVHNDGEDANLTAPGRAAREDALRRAHDQAGVAPQAVRFVELHGTGTPLGDPVEAAAVGAVLGVGSGRGTDSPLLVGSATSNIGHLEGAAGIAGLIKAMLCLRKATLVPGLTFRSANPYLPLDELRMRVNTGLSALDTSDGAPLLACVSSFAKGGTTCHLVLSDWAPAPRSEKSTSRPVQTLAAPTALTLSGRTAEALRAQAAELSAHLAAHPDQRLDNVAHSLATTRTHFEHRAVLLVDDRAAALAAVSSLACGETPAAAEVGTVRTGALAFLFSGEGSQRAGMGRALYDTYPIFAAALDEACALLDQHLDRPLKDLMFLAETSPDAAVLHRTAYAQAALFAYESALYRLLEEWGVTPDAVLGHSVGELAAAHAAGVLSLPDACALVAARGRLMQQLPSGAMASVQASEHEIECTLTGYEGRASIAAVNGPLATVVAGDEDAVLAVADHWRGRGRGTKRLRAGHVPRRPRTDPMFDAFREVASGLTYAAPRIAVVSGLTGLPLSAEDIGTPAHWVRHVRETVRFYDGIRALAQRGAHSYLEVGPDAVLAAMGRDCGVGEHERKALFVPTARPGEPEVPVLLGALAALHVRGAPVAWHRTMADRGGDRVALPTYAFRRRSCRLPAPNRPPAQVRSAGSAPTDHPLFGAVASYAEAGGLLLTGRLSPDSRPWLADHHAHDDIVLPAAVLVELAVHAATRSGTPRIEELTLQSQLVLAADPALRFKVDVTPPDAEGRRALRVYSRPDDADTDAPWTRHAVGVLAEARAETGFDLSVWPPEGAIPVVLDCQEAPFGPEFATLRAAWHRGEDLFAEVALEPGDREQAARFTLPPGLLDTALYALARTTVRGTDADPTTGLLPTDWKGIDVYAAGADVLRVRITPAAASGCGTAGAYALAVADDAGFPVAAVDTVSLTPLLPEEARRAAENPDGTSLFQVGWNDLSLSAGEGRSGGWAVAGDDVFGLAIALTGADAGVVVHSDMTTLVAAAGSAAPEVILVPCPTPTGAVRAATVADAVRTTVEDLLGRVRAWLEDDRLADSRLVFVTRAAAVTGPADGGPDLVGAALWGLLRSVRAEYPGRIGLLDLGRERRSLRLLVAAIASGEAELALRNGSVLVPRLHRSPPAVGTTPLWESGGTVLITGGTGALGSSVARRLASAQRVRNLLLVSRSGDDAEEAAALVEDLRTSGVRVTLAACDVADRDALTALLREIPDEHPLTAVVHAAGALDDSGVAALTAEHIEQVLRPTVEAALHLHELTKWHNLSDFILFSSISGTLGNAGQAAYAAGHAFLDGLAHLRRAEGLPALSLAWGLWDHEGSLIRELGDGDQARLGRLGLAPLGAEEGHSALAAARAMDGPVLVPARFDRAALLARAAQEELPEVLRSLVEASRVPLSHAHVSRRGSVSPLPHPDAAGTTRAEPADAGCPLPRAAVCSVPPNTSGRGGAQP
jgi:acyl transferase domain-containing protein/NADP-dependent 3-hydroxy acid dehydrogenase YdfG